MTIRQKFNERARRIGNGVYDGLGDFLTQDVDLRKATRAGLVTLVLGVGVGLNEGCSMGEQGFAMIGQQVGEGAADMFNWKNGFAKPEKLSYPLRGGQYYGNSPAKNFPFLKKLDAGHLNIQIWYYKEPNSDEIRVSYMRLGPEKIPSERWPGVEFYKLHLLEERIFKEGASASDIYDPKIFLKHGVNPVGKDGVINWYNNEYKRTSKRE